MHNLYKNDLKAVKGGDVPTSQQCTFGQLATNVVLQYTEAGVPIPPMNLDSTINYPVGLCQSTSSSSFAGVSHSLPNITSSALPGFSNSSASNGLGQP